MQILKDCSSKFGMILAKSGELSSRQGFVLISIIQGFICSSIMKSIPSSSKLCYLLFGSRFKKVALTACAAKSSIYDKMLSKKCCLDCNL